MGPRVVDRRLEDRRVAARAERHQDHVRARVHRGDDARDDRAVVPRAVRAEDRDRQHPDVAEGDARDAGAVVGVGADDAGHPRPVAVGVRVGRHAVDERDPGQQPAGEVACGGVDARVQDGNDGMTVGRGAIADVVPADPWQRPLVGVVRVVRGALRGPRPVALDAGDGRVGTEEVGSIGGIGRGQLDDREAELRDLADERRARARKRIGSSGLAGLRDERDEVRSHRDVGRRGLRGRGRHIGRRRDGAGLDDRVDGGRRGRWIGCGRWRDVAGCRGRRCLAGIGGRRRRDDRFRLGRRRGGRCRLRSRGRGRLRRGRRRRGRDRTGGDRLTIERPCRRDADRAAEGDDDQRQDGDRPGAVGGDRRPRKHRPRRSVPGPTGHRVPTGQTPASSSPRRCSAPDRACTSSRACRPSPSPRRSPTRRRHCRGRTRESGDRSPRRWS